MANGDSFIILNVGGICYTTSRLTLTSFPGSMLGNMFKEGGVPPQPDENGHFLIDRDGKMFQYVLNYMRNSKLCLPSSFEECDQLLAEANFFMLPDLEKEISSRLSPKPVQSKSPAGKEVVLLSNFIAQRQQQHSHICVVEAKQETWSKLKFLQSAYQVTMKKWEFVEQFYTDVQMEAKIYQGQFCRFIFGKIVEDGFKLEGTTKFGEKESLVFTYNVL